MTWMSFILGFGTGAGACFIFIFLLSLSVRNKGKRAVEDLRERVNEMSKNNIKQPL
jgi:hypothetical protein